MNMIIITVTLILFILLMYLGYILYLKKEIYEKETILIEGEKVISQNFSFITNVYNLVKRNRLILPNEGNTLIISWHMYLPNVGGDMYWTSSYNKDKPIIKIGNSPHIYYNPKQNVLKIITKYQYSPFENHFPIIEVPNITLQKWCLYTVVIQNNLVRVYIDGELIITKPLETAITIDDFKNTEIKVGEVNNNIMGKISNMKLYFKNYQHHELKSLNN